MFYKNKKSPRRTEDSELSIRKKFVRTSWKKLGLSYFYLKREVQEDGIYTKPLEIYFFSYRFFMFMC